MPKMSYNETRLVKSKKQNFRKYKVITLLAMCLVFVLLLSDLVSNFLTLGSFSFSNIFGNELLVKVQSQTYYAVVMDTLDNSEQAQNMAELLMLQGASGFVWETNNQYKVVGSIYFKETDAKSVKNNLMTTNPKVSVSKMVTKKTSKTYDNYSVEQVKQLRYAYEFINSVVKKLYDYSIKLETKALSPTTVSSHVNELKSDSIIISSRLDVINSTVIYEETIKLKNVYVKLTENLNELVLKLISSDNYNQLIKYSYVKCVKLNYDFYNNL